MCTTRTTHPLCCIHIHIHSFVSSDAVTPLCSAEVGAAAVQDDPLTARVEESKYTSE